MEERIIWRPHPGPQTRVLTRQESEILFGGSRGGGKTEAMTVWMVDPEYIKQPRYRGLVIRRNYDDLKDWIDRAKYLYRYMGVKVTGNPAQFEFPSGAKIWTGHLSNEDAWTKYLGQEYQKIGIEELTLIPNELDYLKLISSARSTIPGIKAQVFGTTNPGGPGHGWVKARFVDVARNKTHFDEKSGKSRIFIPSKVTDNPTIMREDPEYINSLKALPDELRRAWLDGDWDVFSGQFFQKWRQDLHVIEPFDIPYEWYKYRSIDYGFAAPFACGWWAVDFFGNVYLYREHYEAGQELSHHIDRIIELSGQEEYMMSVGDPSMWIRNPQNTNRSDIVAPSNMSIADILSRAGINMFKANNERINGWNLCRQYIDHYEGQPPKLKVFSTCPNFIRTIPTLVHDDKKPEDLNTRGEDHHADQMRYFLHYVGSPTKVIQKPWLQKELDKLLSLETDYSGIRA